MRDVFGNKVNNTFTRNKVQSYATSFKDPVPNPTVDDALLKGVNIVIPIHNSLRTVVPLFESLKKYTSPLVKYTIVDDCSDNFTKDYLKNCDLPNVTVLRNHLNRKYTYSINRGFNHAASVKSEFIIGVNSDLLVTEGWLERMLLAATSSERVGIVCPYMSNAALLTLDIPPGANHHETAQRLAAISTKSYPDAVTPVGACMLVKSKTWQECGPFDEKESPEGYGEECFFWVHALKKGWKAIIADDCFVYHESHASFGDSASRREKKAVDNFMSKHRVFYSAKFTQAQQKNILPKLKHDIRTFKIKDARPNVCFYITNIQLCGGILALVNICNELNEIGVSATIAYERDLNNEFPLMPCRFKPILLTNRSNNWIKDGGFSNGYIVATAWFTGDFVLELCNKFSGLKPIAFIQDREDLFRLPNGNAQYSRRSQFERYLAIAKNKSIVNSNWVFESLIKDYQFNRDNMQYIPIGVDPYLFYPTGKREENQLVKILSFCRPTTPRRGYRLLSDLFVKLHESFNTNIELYIYGEGANPKVPCVSLGRLSQRRLATEMAKADILIEPSSVQGWGMPGQEMMTTGGCLITTDNGGIHNYGVHNRNCLIGGKTVDTMFNQVSRAIKDKDLRDRVGAQAREDMLRFHWKNIAQCWKETLI